MPTKKPNRSKAYLFTIDPMSAVDAEALLELRKVTRHINRDLKGVRFQVAVSPRAVKKQHRWKYQNKHRPRYRIEDASSVDVYVTRVSTRGKPRRAT